VQVLGAGYFCIKIENMKKVLLGILIAFSLSAQAQETVPLSLQDAVEAALRSNKEIIMAGLDEESARARFKQTDAVFLPQISLSYSAMSTNNPLNAFGFKLQQQAIAPADFDPALLNNPSSTQNFMTKAEWQQPILNVDMLYARKAARQQSAVFEFKTKRLKDYLTMEVEKAYWQLQLTHQAKEVLNEALQTVNAIYTATSNRYEKGYLQKSDLLQVRVQVITTESQLAEAKSNVLNASDYLALLMGSKSGTLYSLAPMEEAIITDSIEATISESRADFQAMQSAIVAQDQMINSNKVSIVPNLNAFGQYLINDSEAFGFGSNSYLVGAQLSWGLFKGMSVQHKATEQRIERNRMVTQLSYQKEQSQLELSKTIRELQDSRFALQQQKLTVNQAEEALRILQNRYQQGLVTTNDLLQAQSLLSQQKLRQAQTYFQVNTTKAYLRFLSNTSEK
jgi:outer membrane protein TolC